MKCDTEQMSPSQNISTKGKARTRELSSEEMLEVMAREGRLPADLVPHWEGVKEWREHSLRMALDEIEINLLREVIMGDAERVACVLWIAHTYVYDKFKMSPRLFITSGNPGSGKTTLLTLISEMASGGQRFNKTSVAALGRLKETYGSALTVALDQLDNAFEVQASDTGKMLDALISGGERDAKQVLVEKGTDGRFHTVEYDLFYPMALTKIGTLPSPALLSRCIVIQMHPATAEEAMKLVAHAKEHADPNIRPLIRKVLEQLPENLAAANLSMATTLINRGADKWRPLLTIAQAAGGDWPNRAVAAADQLESYEPERPPHVILLGKVIVITKDWPHDVIFSEELDRALDPSERTEIAWAKHRARLLGVVGLKPERHWRGEKQARGYRIADIRKAADKYIRPDTCDG